MFVWFMFLEWSFGIVEACLQSIPFPHATMKLLFLLLAPAVLVGCSSIAIPQTEDSSSPEFSESIRAFELVCLKTAPSFAEARRAAESLGIDQFMETGAGVAGLNADNSLGAQIKPGRECAITTPSQENATLSKQLYRVAYRYANMRARRTVPAVGRIKSDYFYFLHDREGGEAFVMVRLNADDKALPKALTSPDPVGKDLP